ncbi:hypothetical protein AQI95_29145 [Streptomyces yokosukanensis]|uniref:Uncharacterized protein n=1 Tax=Streptomyces yokosukanensis TaxID=67386 RepID=A0A101NZR4_9ACTN|nr:hypothetical protein AQI95_29145 [Streptomyces yokosukanensis]
MDLRPQAGEEGDDSVGRAEAQGSAGGDGGALLAVGLGLVATGVVAPRPDSEADGEGTDNGDDAEQVDAVDDVLQDGQARQAAPLGGNARVVGELDESVGDR